jgi:transposase InsO family protein
MTKVEHQRQVKLRQSILNHYFDETSNASATCRHYGISRKTFYKWLQRYNKFGKTGLSDRSKKPENSPRATSKEVVSKVLYLRQNYHFGAGRVVSYLKRYHQISISSSTVQSILKKHDLNRLPVNKKKYERSNIKWKRYEKQQPGHRVQIDVKFLERIPGKNKRFYQFTAIDDCTRIRVLKIYDKCNQKTAIDFMNEVIKKLPFRILVVQTDNGSEFQSHFHWYLADKDIQHVYIKPRTPRLNGKVERSHRIDDQEFYQLLDKNWNTSCMQQYNLKLKEWEDYYNFDRPHGALDGQTPYERLKQKKMSVM